MGSTALTEQSRAILEMIAKGHSYEQILVQELAWRYQDIFDAAAEALAAAGSAHQALPCNTPVITDGKTYDVDEIRQSHPHAYAKWTSGDDDRLRQLFVKGKSIKELAYSFQRQPSAIRSRLGKLGLKA